MSQALTYSIASYQHISAILELRNAVASALASKYGPGHWSHECSESRVRMGITTTSHVILAWKGTGLVGSFRLAQKKPWAIDISYFTPVPRPLYLLDMVVDPRMQRQGIGKEMLSEAARYALQWPAQSIRLDAYDTAAGAGEFYRKCGYRETGRVKFRHVPLIYFELLLS